MDASTTIPPAGSWYVGTLAGGHDFAIVEQATGKDVALSRGPDRGRAELLAAAPDLLAALHKAREWVEHVEAVAWDSIPEDMRGDNGVAWAIRSAVARATGG